MTDHYAGAWGEWNQQAISGPPVNKYIAAYGLLQQYTHIGAASISGTVLVEGLPARRRVYLFDRVSMLLLKDAYSDPVTGAFTFRYLSTILPFVAVSLDTNNVYDGVIHDRLTAS